MSKGFIIGMAGLGIGLAVAGGVGGYFINEATKPKQITNTVIKNETQITENIVYQDYVLPEEFGYVSHNLYEIGDNFAMLSSNSIGCYLLNKETKQFNFFNSSYVSNVSEVVNGYKYFWLENKNLFKVNVENGEHEIVALNSGVAFYSLNFIGSNGNKMFMKGYSSGNSNEYYFLVFDTENGTSEVFSINSSQHSGIEVCIDLNGKYFLSHDYSGAGSSSYMYGSMLVDCETKEITTISDYELYGKKAYLIKDNKIYAILRSDTTTGLCCINTEDGTVTSLKTSLYNYGSFIECENGFVYAYERSIGSSSFYSSASAYYVDYETDEISPITVNGSSTNCCVYNIENKLIFTPSSASTNKYGTLAVLNFETKELEIIYTALVSSSNSSYCSISEFDGRYFVTSDNSNYAEMIIDEQGEISFKRLALKCSVSGTKYELGDNKYIIASEGIKYYDFDNDVYKSLLSGSSSSSYSVKNIEIEKNIATLYISNHIKYEFNLDTLSFKAVARWEEVEA